MADINDPTQNVAIWDDDKGKNVSVITDAQGKERLAVDVDFTSRVTTSVHEADMDDSSATHISYTVPTGKVLYIQTLTACYSSGSGGENYLEWQEDGVGFHPQYISDGSGYTHALFTDGNPIGPFAAGVVVRAQRITGASRAWSAAFTGYLEDA